MVKPFTQALVLMFALTMTAVSASEDICLSQGFDFTAATYHWQDGAYLADAAYMDSYGLDIYGDASHANWTSEQPVAGVVMMAGTEPVLLDGGESGSFDAWVDEDGRVHEIGMVSFCGEDMASGVPEYSLLSLALAVMLGTLGLIILRRN